MSARFEIHLNGKPLCVTGIPDLGVLTVIISRVEGKDVPEEITLGASGLGCYHPELPARCHVGWKVPDHLSIGDVVTVRILPPGDYDDPVNVQRSPSKEIDDPDFGIIRFNISAWYGKIPFVFPLTRTTEMRVRLLSTQRGPSKTQRKLFKQLKSRYAKLWPLISEALCRCHRDFKSTMEVNQHLNPIVSLSIEKSNSNEISLDYKFDTDSEFTAYWVTIRDWEVVEISRAD